MAKNEAVYAICCRQKITDDVFAGEDVKTIERYALLNFEAAGISNFRENENQPFV